MSIKALLATAIWLATSFSLTAGAAECDPGFSTTLRASERLVDSLQPAKPGLARVYAADGSEFTAGQALWLKGQMREIRKACAQGHPADAAGRLKSVQELLAARAPPAA
jgi:hypothetical protein